MTPASTGGADVAVLGAGPAGLAAALRLARTGRSVVVVDRAAHVGGLTASLVVGDQRVDLGSHRLHPSTDPAILALLRELLGTDLQERARNGRIRLFDRWVGFPLRPADLARSLPPAFLMRAGTGAAAAMVRPRRDETFADVVTTGLGTVMGEEFYFPYARKIWGVDPSRLSGAQARRRISADSPVKLIRKAVRPTAGRTFFYPAGGFGRIGEALAAAAVDAGATIRLGEAVTQILPRRDEVVVRTDAGALTAGTVLSTVPLTTLAAALDPSPGPLPELRYRSIVLVYLVVDGGPYSPFDAHYLPGPRTPVTRVSEPRNYRTPTTAWPDPVATTVLCVEMPGDPDDARWSSTDADLVELAVDALTGSGLPAPVVVGSRVLRRRHAYPVYEVGYETALGPLLDDVAARPRVLSYGRQGLFAHDNTHHAMAMAWAAADAVQPDGQVDRANWAAALDVFSQHVVED